MGSSKAVIIILAVFVTISVSIGDVPGIAATSLGAGFATIAAVLWKMAAQDVEYLLSGDRLLSIATITNARSNLTWTFNHDKAENLFRSEAPLWCATTAGIAIAWAVLLASHAIRLSYSKPILLFIGLFITLILLVARITVLSKVHDDIKKHHLDVLAERMHEMLPALDTATHELRKLHTVQNDIDIFRRDLGLRQSRNFVTRAATAIASSARMTVDNYEVDTTAIQAVLLEAEEEREHLAQATASYASATSRLAQVRRSIDTLGVSSLSHRIDDLSHMLSSCELKSLVTKRQWREFSEVMGLLVADLDALKRQTRRSARGGADSGEPPAPEDGGTSVAWACQVLNLPRTATKAEIKRAFRTLCTKWHPDTGRVTDDTKIKRITEAYHFLKKAKRVA